MTCRRLREECMSESLAGVAVGVCVWVCGCKAEEVCMYGMYVCTLGINKRTNE